MAVDYARIHRLLKIVTLIQGAPGWSSRRLATECKTTTRTIFRDMKMLEGAGIPYFYDDQNKCYGIQRDFFLPPVQLTLDEALALSALAEHVGKSEQVPFLNAASKAIDKVRGQLPHSIRQALADGEQHLAIKLAASNPPEGSSDVYQVVRQALTRRTALRCRYESLKTGVNGDEAIEFTLRPYKLLFNQRAWYVIGYHSQHKELRCLKLNRFSSVQPTTETYSIPKSFTLQNYLGNAWRLIRGKQSYDVELHFDAEFAETIADTHWHATQEVTWNDDQSIRFTARVDGLDEIVWWILSMGPHCKVIQPAELATRVRNLAAEMVRLYPRETVEKKAKPTL